MRVLLSTIGTRGDVQPLLALAIHLRARGVDVDLCVPPDFRDAVEAHGLDAIPIGPTLRTHAALGAPPASAEERRRLARASVAEQFAVIGRAAAGADLVVGATALQIGAPSIAEHLRIPYVFVAYCPAVLPSPEHAPLGAAPGGDIAALWAAEAQRFDATFGEALDAERAALGLAPVTGVRDHVLTVRPWLAADEVLAPWSGPSTVVQTGAWLLRDARPLEPVLERFLAAGEAPIYFGLGSMRSAEGVGRAMVDAARALGRRAILSRGWANLEAPDDADLLVIDDVSHEALLPRVAAVVHHGGAGTTTAAALAGVPQVVVPHLYDQAFWADRVERLGIGTAHAKGALTAPSLTSALEKALAPDVAARARALAPRVRRDGAEIAAERIVTGAW